VRRRIPIFPLPGVVFFPETTLPLHVFEPRYREMLADALAGDRVLGIQLLNPAGRRRRRPSVGLRDRLRRRDRGARASGGRPVEHPPARSLPVPDRTRSAGRPALPRGRGDGAARDAAPGRRPLPRPATSAPAGRRRAARRRRRTVSGKGASRRAVRRGDRQRDPDAPRRRRPGRLRLLAMDALADRYAFAEELVVSMQRRLDLLAPFRPPRIEPRWN